MKGKPVIPPVYLTATYQFDQSDDLIDVVQNRSGYLYSRWDNPSVEEVENALAEYELAVELDPELAEAHFGLGVVYLQTNQNQKSILAFERFLELDEGQDPMASEQAVGYLKELKGQ